MKHRLGFVSNSSSMSFWCDICDYEYDGHSDYGPDIVECDDGHEFCSEHLSKEILQKYGYNNIACIDCPVCQKEKLK